MDLRSQQIGHFEVLVQWRGLELADATWEPLQNLYEDVPVLITRFLQGLSEEISSKARCALGITGSASNAIFSDSNVDLQLKKTKK